MKPLRAVTLDMWGTLIEWRDYRAKRIRFLAERLGIPRPRAQEAYEAAAQRADATWRSEAVTVASAGRVNWILQDLGLSSPEALRAELVRGFEEMILETPPALLPGVGDAVRTLARHFPLALISDIGLSPARMLRQVLADHDLLSLFRATVFSDEAGRSKPDARPFRLALEKLGVAAGESLHAGDLLETDIAGAKNMGMRAVWIDAKGKGIPEDSIRPDHILRSLADLPELALGMR